MILVYSLLSLILYIDIKYAELFTCDSLLSSSQVTTVTVLVYSGYRTSKVIRPVNGPRFQDS